MKMKMKKRRLLSVIAVISVMILAFSFAITGCGTVTVESVSLDKTTLALTKGDKSTLVATVSPEDATDASVTWSSDKTSVATVSASGEVSAVGGGTATITVTTTDGSKTATCTVTVTSHVESVGLDETEARLAVGGEKTLQATVLPSDATDKSVAWSSSDPTVATVANGVITAVKAGTTTITVTTTDGSKTAACEVTVYVPAAGVSLDKTEARVIRGETVTLEATVTPNDATDKTVAWSSSNAAVATVVNGVVTAVATGTATITATTTDGGLTATCAVTVYVPAAGVSLNKTTTELLIGDTESLTATVSPDDATDKSVSWSSSAEAVATVSDSGVITAVGVGTATVTVTTTDGDRTAACEVTVYDFNNKPGELAFTASLSGNRAMVNNKANSIVTFNAEAAGTLYYTTKSGLAGRNAFIADEDTLSVEVEKGEGFVMLELASEEVLSAHFLLVEELTDGQTAPETATRTSDITTVTWTANAFFTPDTTNGEISNWTELKAALATNADITLACNIDAEGEAYAPTLSGYSSTFDGRGFAIINLNITPTANTFGLFKSVQTPVVFKDLTFLNPTINGGTYTEGGLLAGTNNEPANNVMTVTNVTVSGLTYTGSGNQQGGLFGRIKGNTADLQINNCNIDSTFVSTGSKIGGVVGYIEYNSKLSVTDSKVNTHFADGTAGSQKGGIIGHLNFDLSVLTVTNSEVNVTVTNSKGVSQYGGVAGQISASTATVENSSVVITLIDSSATRQGAIAGTLDGVAKVTVKQSYIGSVFSGVYTNDDGSIANDERKGGVIGILDGLATLTVDNCYIDMKVNKTNTSVIAGIIGANENGSFSVTHSYVNMDVTGTPGVTGPVLGYYVNDALTLSDSAFVTNYRSNAEKFCGSDAYLKNEGAGTTVTNTEFVASASEVTSAVIDSIVGEDSNPDGYSLWSVDEETNTLEFTLTKKTV